MLFDPELKCLNIEVDFPPESRFPHPESGQDCAVYDSEARSWRHMNFCQFECHVNARVPRVDGRPGFVRQLGGGAVGPAPERLLAGHGVDDAGHGPQRRDRRLVCRKQDEKRRVGVRWPKHSTLVLGEADPLRRI